MIEEDTIRSEETGGFTKLHRRLKRLALRKSVWIQGTTRRLFGPGTINCIAEHLRTRRLEEAYIARWIDLSQRVQKLHCARHVHLRRSFGIFQACLNMRLRREIIDLRRPHLADDIQYSSAVPQVAAVQAKAAFEICEFLKSSPVEALCGSGKPVNEISLFKQQLSEIAAILPGNAGYQSDGRI